MQNKLRPCPFCGGKAELRFYQHHSTKSWSVRCKNMCIVTCGHKDDKGRWRPTLMREAIETWNRRAGDESDGL